MSAASLSRWARRFLFVGVAFLVASAVAALVDLPRSVVVILALQGFVCTVVFGKAYSLLPSYFDRSLAWPRAPALHLPLATLGVVGLTVARVPDGFPELEAVGATLWAAGVLVFLGTLAVTIRDNPLGTETGTGDVNADRERLDRIANAFMPVALGYLALGTYELLAASLGLPTVFDGATARVSHLLAAGFAATLLFSVGFRLLPRFLVASPPRWLPSIVLVSGSLGPLLVAAGLYSGPVFRAGAALEAVAVFGFAVGYLALFARSNRRRVGFYGPLAGVVAGVLGVGLGLQFAVTGLDPTLATAHYRLNLFGFLGLSIVGVLYQFYPPGVGEWPLAGDRLALGTLVAMSGGVAAASFGPPARGWLTAAGFVALALAGLGTLYLLLATVAAHATRG